MMRRPWIKIETATPDKPEICAIATRLRIDTDSVVGKLVRLWSWAEVNRVDGNDIGVTKEFIDKLVGRKGFAEALEAAGWLIAQDETLQFANFERHNGNASKIRGQTAKRVERHRQRQPSPKAAPLVKTIEESAPLASPEAASINTDLDVKNTQNPLIENETPLEFHSSIQPEVELEALTPNNDFIVTKTEQDSPLLPIDTATDEGTEEGESSGKLPRLTKRAVRLPADEDQPMLF
jgi:DNA replication protein DnaT